MIEHEGVAGGSAPEDRIDAALREHFARGRIPAPSFEQTFAQAQAQAQAQTGQRATGGEWVRRWRLPEAGLATATLLLVIFLVSEWGEVPNQEEPKGHSIARTVPAGFSVLDDRLLFAELERTTRWTAPSDRWRSMDSLQMAGGLPDFSNMKFDMKENLKWSQLDG